MNHDLLFQQMWIAKINKAFSIATNLALLQELRFTISPSVIATINKAFSIAPGATIYYFSKCGLQRSISISASLPIGLE
jgi:predicted GTPase